VVELKVLARIAAERFGGKPSATRYRHDASDLWIDIVKCEGSLQGALDSYSTVGMSTFDNETTGADGLPLRVELTAAAQPGWPLVANGLASAAFNVGTGEYICKPGIVYPDLFTGYEREVTTPHGLIWWPFVWDADWQPIIEDGIHIEWLTVIPVTADEAEFFADHGADALIDLFEQQTPDLYDLSRQSVSLSDTPTAG